MQTIVHSRNYTFIHPIFTEFERLYTELSNDDRPKSDSLLNDSPFELSLRPFGEIFNERGNCVKTLKYAKKRYKPMPKQNYDAKNVIVTFSGGKDSTAVALYYKERGYNVYLYHVHGLNKLFPFEQQSAEAVAKHLGLPIVVENVSLSGVSLYPDHPLKNIIIANMALQWGIANNVGAFVTAGDYYTAYLDDVCFETAGDDAIEMWNTYRPIMEQYIPDFKLEIPLVNVEDTLERLSHDKELLSLTQSCVMTHRFKAYHKRRVEAKYGIQLMPNRCGTCWKCALEYIYYTDKDVLDYNRAFYENCLGVLRRTLQEETGERSSIDEVWNHFFFYSQTQSKYFTENLSLTS